MNNIQTYPELYFENKNYIPIKIDLSDLEETMENIKNKKIDIDAIAQEGHKYFLNIINHAHSLEENLLYKKLIEVINN